MGVIGKINAEGATHLIAPTVYGTCSTAAATAAKTVAINGFTLMEGVTIWVKFTNENTADNPTLNVNSTGAKSIKMFGTTTVTSWIPGAMVSLTYDGTNWILNNSNSYFDNTPTSVNLGTVSVNPGVQTLLTSSNASNFSKGYIELPKGHIYLLKYHAIGQTNKVSSLKIAYHTTNSATSFPRQNYGTGDMSIGNTNFQPTAEVIGFIDARNEVQKIYLYVWYYFSGSTASVYPSYEYITLN